VGYAQPTYDADSEAKLIALEQVEKCKPALCVQLAYGVHFGWLKA
jgi:hypothetical protein